MVTVVEVVTELVVTVKFALVLPAATVTLDGTEAAGPLLVSETETLLDGAAVSVTVPVEEVPAVTLVGLRVSEDTVTDAAGGLTVRVAVLVTPL